MTKMGAISLLKETIIKAMEYKKDDKEYDSKSVALQKVIDGNSLFISAILNPIWMQLNWH